MAFRKRADDYEDILLKIEQKKQEILERKANSENPTMGSKGHDMHDDDKSDASGEGEN